MSKNKFRIIVVLSILLACFAEAYDYLFPDPITEQVMDFTYNLEPEHSENSEMFFYVIIGLAIVLAIASVVGILRFKNWGRHLYLAGFILLIPLYPYMGITVYSGWGQAFYDASMLLSGALLALMYYSPVAAYFET